MDVKTVSMPKGDAEKAYKEYLAVIKTRKKKIEKKVEKHLEDLKKVYHALKDGKKVIDIYDAFEDTGIDEDGNPKLAIAQAHRKRVTFRKEIGGGGIFSSDAGKWNWQEKVVDVRLPAETFSEWKDDKGVVPEYASDIAQRESTTRVPIIPAHLMPKGKLEKYYLLWEVDEWKPVPKVKDPFLLKRINANTFIVLAAWDLTEVEQIVMRGQ